ncbi:TerB family tellurite resistance protein [Opacimonas viscosa]|uniref:TerB family tellurite resistance protein n=1 Tax=Opacimonas viscosa TaxID=2961944 RepID=A0AA42BLQ8_9ALTE|nr:TerB family tellurite resistance protein [Opacimonas viscosa]MCP3428859.1 TerB family tellurite resistance protein [Opacimonas viscosa]
MQLSPLQRFNESLIKLSVLLYQIDGKITLSEQDYLEDVIADLTWQSPISIDAFTNDAIHQARVAVDNDEALAFVKEMVDDLTFDAEKVVEVAMGITGIDGERSEQETDILTVLTHKYLARELTVQHSVA